MKYECNVPGNRAQSSYGSFTCPARSPLGGPPARGGKGVSNALKRPRACRIRWVLGNFLFGELEVFVWLLSFKSFDLFCITSIYPPTLPCSSQAGRRLGPPLVWSFSLLARLSRHQCLSPCLRQCLRLHASFRNSCLVPPHASNTSQRLRDSFGRLVPPTDCFGRTSVFVAFRHCCLAPPNASNPSKTLQRLRDCCTASDSLLWPSETAVWHPQTLPTLPKPRSASETAAAPPRVFYDLPKLLFGTPKPFQPFSNPSKTSQRLRDCCRSSDSLLWPSKTPFWHPQTLPTLPTLPKPRSASETARSLLWPFEIAVWHPQTLPTLPTLPKPRSASETAAAPPTVFYDLPKLLFGTPKPFQPFQNLAAPQRLLQGLQECLTAAAPPEVFYDLSKLEAFMTFQNCCLAPPNASNPSKTLQRLRDCCSASDSLLWPSETAVWHPQTLPTLPTLPKPRSASATAAGPPRVFYPRIFYDLPKLLFGTPQRFQPFQPFQNLAAPQRLAQRLRESFIYDLPKLLFGTQTLPTLPKPRSASATAAGPPRVFCDLPKLLSGTPQRFQPFQPFQNLAAPQRTAAAPPTVFYDLPKLLFGTPKPFQPFQNLAAPQRLLQGLQIFFTFRNCCLAPPNPSNPSKTSQRLRICCSASDSLLWPSKTAVWHPQTLPTLPKPRSASETAAGPPRVFDCCSASRNLLWPFETRAWYLHMLQLRCSASDNILWPSKTAVWHPQTLPTLPTLPKPRSASETAAGPPRVFDCCSASRSLLWPFETRAWYLHMLPKPRSASETPSEGWSRQLTALAALLFLWPSDTAVWHPPTLPTLPTLIPKPCSASETTAAPPTVFYDLPKLLFGTPKPFQPFQPFQNLAAPQRLLQRLRQSFMTFQNCCWAPPNPSNPSNTSQRLRDCCRASKNVWLLQRLQKSFMTFRNSKVLWPSKTVVWHPPTLPTLPTLPKPCSASETAAAPPTVFYDLPKLLFGTPKPFQPLPTLPKPRSASATAAKSLLWPSETAVWHPPTLPTLPTLPKPRSASEDCCSASDSLSWPSETAVWHPQTLPTLPTLPKPRSASETAAGPPSLLWPFETAVWHPQTLPTLPKPRSASETAAGPPRLFDCCSASRSLLWPFQTPNSYDLPKLLFGTPQRFQPFQNLAAPQRLLQRLRQSFMTFRNCCLAPPNPSNPSNPSKTSPRLRDCCQESFVTFRNCCLAPPNASNPSNPSKTSQRLRDWCSASESLLFMTFRNCCLAPPKPSNPSNPSKTSQRLRDCCRASKNLLWPSETAVWHPPTLSTLPTLPKPRSASEDCCSASDSLLWPSETAVWHPQTFPTLPTLPKPRSASATAAGPPRVFYDFPKLLFGTPQRLQPFQPFQNLAAPQRLVQRLRESFVYDLPKLLFGTPKLFQPFQPFQNLAAPQRTAAAPPRVFYDLPKLLFGTPKPFQPFQNLAAPQRTAAAPPTVFYDLPKLLFGTPKPFQPFQPFQNLAAPQRLLQGLQIFYDLPTGVWQAKTCNMFHNECGILPRENWLSSYRNHKKGVGGTRALAHSIWFDSCHGKKSRLETTHLHSHAEKHPPPCKTTRSKKGRS